MGATILQDLWQLRTDPFFPQIDAKGTPIPGAAVDRSLDPLIDDRVLPLYFDVYDWTASDILQGLSPHGGFSVFPTGRNLPLLILISGSGQIGRDSLANLVLHRIKQISGKPSLVADSELEGRDKMRNVAAVARRVITKLKYEKPAHPDAAAIVKQMEEEYDRTRKEQEGRKDATYTDLFGTYRDLLAPLERQVVIKVTGGGDHDSWARIYDSVKSCCSYVVVMTSERVYAKTCYDAMIAPNRNVAWIQTTPLDQGKASNYLEARLAQQRVGGGVVAAPTPLFPFTPAAIDALYQAGPGAKPANVTYPVGFLRQTLNRALTDQLSAVAKAHPDLSPATVAGINLGATTIGAAELLAAREKLNQGR